MTRVVVIGSGIAGASVAYHLAKAGSDVVVVDDARPGQATAAGAGIITPVGIQPVSAAKSELMFAAVAHYVRLVEQFVEGGLAEHSYAATGELIAARDNDELRRLAEVTDRAGSLIREHGTAGVGSPELLDHSELRRRFPLLSTALGAVWLPEVARVDGRVVRDHLVTLGRRGGARFVESTGELVVVDSRVTGVRCAAGLFEADHVVVAAGAWSSALAGATGFDPQVYPQRGQIVHLRLPGGGSDLPVVSVFGGIYLLSFPGDRIVIGATREDHSGYAASVTAGGVDMLLRKAFGVVPRLSEAEWLEVRVGLRPASRDGEPLVGPAPGVEGLWLATGFGPQGLTLAPYSGWLLARAILGESVEFPVPMAATRLAAPVRS
ncbi:NAD(P)/FAD-dependent oxidoreductase [Phytoactinopolyspora limicola]|uniref:NAD(P)/FAD-dependent oxidoreductase n=1 Tax=Phytoactinopolyspora limicola TaxID=2715536 RepID=UPI00140B163E|nr:FAD-dependent oxidoreductase [Phytoactinopolyspora limicola]